MRSLLDDALADGEGAARDGVRTSWRLLRSGPSPVRPEEREHADRLLRNQLDARDPP